RVVPTVIFTLSLHDALPISISVLFMECPYKYLVECRRHAIVRFDGAAKVPGLWIGDEMERDLNVVCHNAEVGPLAFSDAKIGALDRKSTRLNSSHVKSSYAV